MKEVREDIPQNQELADAHTLLTHTYKSLLPVFPPKEQSRRWQEGSKRADGQNEIYF